MMFHRPGRLRVVLLCSAIISSVAFLKGAPQSSTQQPPAQEAKPQQQTPPPQQQPSQQQRPPQPPPASRPNPFETLPTAPAQPPPETPKPAQPPLQTVPPPTETPVATRPGQPPQDIIEAFEFRGARRVRQDTLQALIFSKKGDKYDEETLHRDFMALWNTGRFDDISIEREPGKEGWIIRFVVV
jgi:outer membrane protein insertion porin family